MLPLLAVLLISLMKGVGARAECFCLAHPTTDLIVRYGCSASVIPNRTTLRVTCRDNATTLDRSSVTQPGQFSRVEAGQGACNPCDPAIPAALDDLPRGSGKAVGR